MSDKNVYEITIVAKDAKRQASEIHAEYTTAAADPKTAARELMDAVVTQRAWRDQVREIDPAR